MRSVYDRACSYAWKCSPWLYKDLVHHAWLLNFEKDGTNLFDKDIYHVLRCIRNAWFNEIKKGKYMYEGEFYKKDFVSNERLINSEPLPDQQLITKQFYDELYKRVSSYFSGHPIGKSIRPETLIQFVSLVDQGYSNPEIAEVLEVTTQAVYYYRKKIKSIIQTMQINNPFAANRAVPIKKITKKQYEEKYKDEYVCDFNRQWCDENETALLAVHKEREEYILVKLTKD